MLQLQPLLRIKSTRLRYCFICSCNFPVMRDRVKANYDYLICCSWCCCVRYFLFMFFERDWFHYRIFASICIICSKERKQTTEKKKAPFVVIHVIIFSYSSFIVFFSFTFEFQQNVFCLISLAIDTTWCCIFHNTELSRVSVMLKV